VGPAEAARPIVDLHRLDAYFALFASDSNVPWKTTKVRLDTYSSAPVNFAVYQVDPIDVITAGSNARARAIDTRGRRPVASFTYTPPGGYQFQSNQIDVPLGSREGFFVVEARRGAVGEQVWINRTRVGLVTKETPGEALIYGADLGSGKALPRMRVQLLVNNTFESRETDAHGLIRWNKSPRPIFALAQWGNSYAFTSLLPQAPLPNTIVGVRTDTAVVHAGDSVRVVGFARSRSGSLMKSSNGSVDVSMRLGATLVAQMQAPLDSAGAFSATITVPATAATGDYAVLAQVDGGVGGATVHVDASAGGLSLGVAAACEVCPATQDVPISITSSRGGASVHVTVIRSPHIYLGRPPDAVPWATTKWLDTTVRTGADGHAEVHIAQPTDGLSSTYGIRVESGGATAVTRVLVPTAHATARLSLERTSSTLGTPINFDVYANDIASGKPLSAASVTVNLNHGPSTQQQTLTLDANGHARGTFNDPTLGMNLITATVVQGNETASDAGQVDVVPKAGADLAASGSSQLSLQLDRAVYHSNDDAHADASLPGATGDALLTLESALGSQASVSSVSDGHARATLHVNAAAGDLRVSAALVRDGSLEWTSVPLAVDAPGMPEFVPLDVGGSAFAPGASTTVSLLDTAVSSGTIVVRVSRGSPSGSALFDSAPSLLAVGAAATQLSAPAGQTWHPWVDSTGDHAQVLGFERRTEPPPDLVIEEADTQALTWTVGRDDGKPIAVQLPAARGRYTLSVLKMTDDGRVVAGSAVVVVQ
jgi:hypothetical protein